MSPQPPDVEVTLQQLRNQVALLMTQNLELRRQLEDLRRSRTDAPIADLALGAINAVRNAEGAMVELSGGGPRYVISELETEFKGVVVAQEAGLGFRVPLPEYGSAPGHLGRVRMVFRHVPPPSGE